MDARSQRPLSRRRPSGQRWWLHGLLLLLTALTTTIVGSRLAANFEANRPAFVIDEDFSFFLTIFEYAKPTPSAGRRNANPASGPATPTSKSSRREKMGARIRMNAPKVPTNVGAGRKYGRDASMR